MSTHSGTCGGLVGFVVVGGGMGGMSVLSRGGLVAVARVGLVERVFG